MLPEERKAIARLAHEAINQKNLTLLEDHPGRLPDPAGLSPALHLVP